MIAGEVTEDGEPSVWLEVAGQRWKAVIDTGFNGDLELPEELRRFVNPRFSGRIDWLLAAGQRVSEDSFAVDFPFDGQTVLAIATFTSEASILIGTNLLQDYRLEINFPARTVLLEQIG